MVCTAVVLLATLPTCSPAERRFGDGLSTSVGDGGSAGDAGNLDICVPGTKEICYDGPAETAGIGVCKTGLKPCNAYGSGYSPCEGDILPAPELCDTIEDENCDGETNEACVYTRCTALPSGSPSGIYMLDPENAGQDGAHAAYCDMQTDGGGWALLYNSIGSKEGTTLPFWNIPYADRLGAKGSPSLESNVYAGWLYPHGHEYRDEVEDLAGTIVEVLRAQVAGIRQDDMHFEQPMLVSGPTTVYIAQLASGWSSADFDGDPSTDNCAVSYSNVSQHYGRCWVYNLGADADAPTADEGWGPHMHSTTAASLGLLSDASPYTRVKRISRWTRW